MDYITEVEARLNGKQAEQELKQLRDRAESLRQKLEEAFLHGTKESQRYFQQELKKTNADLRRMESGVNAVNRTMQQLNRATPKDLNRALRFLQGELKNIERGSAAWNAQVAKIKAVKAELDKVNAELKQSESFFTRMKNTVNGWGASIAAGAAALTGLVAAGKKAVQTYAEMQQEEANVRKYTGMTEEQVAHLNDAFKKMDTRTSREELNKLAQEAGRLGLQSEEDVLGFVRAADKINVALDDLGEGATLTLSKLTDIFGDKERLGVERSLLATGSVINELSQNSTAAAPYLAEFGQRLAGVGAQAHMTIPEIMGFGAVLDSQGQKLEMSSTALSKVIMSLFKNPEKIAKATGLAVEEFSETCKRSTNEGLMMLLDRLHELGGIDTLAPVFADMGENGARASAVLAALAGNVDEVRKQQEAANVAFNEAVSIDKEFAVQNETVQAGLEKARKGFNEMAVTLGKELMPIVSKLISSTSMTMQVMLKVIQFVKEYRVYIVSTAAAIAGYTIAVNAAKIAEAAWNAVKKVGTAIQWAWNAAMMANPIGLLVAGLAAATAGLVMFLNREKEQIKAVKQETEMQKKLIEIEEKHKNQYAEEAGRVKNLTTVIENNNLSLEQRRKALKQLQEIVPDYHAKLTDEGKLINNNKAAIDNYITSLKESIRIKANEEKLQTIAARQVELEDSWGEGGNLSSQKKTYDELNGVLGNIRAAKSKQKIWSNEFNRLEQEERELLKTINRSTVQYKAALHEYEQLQKESDKIMNSGHLPGKTVNPDPTGTDDETPDEKNQKKQHDDALKEIEDWKKKENALNQIAYLQGDKDYQTYSRHILRREAEYWEKRMGVEQEGSAEWLDAQAKMLDAQAKLDRHFTGLTVEEEQLRYSETKRILDQRYADGEMTAKAYQLATEQAELQHLQNMVQIYEEGSEEHIKAQEAYQQKSLQYQRKHAEEARKMQDNLRNEYFKNAGGNANPEGMAEEKAQLEIVRTQLLAAATSAEQRLQIEEAYQKARYEIAKKYGDKAEMMAVNKARATQDKILEYINSDGFQAFTQSFSTIVNGMGQIFSGLSSLIDAETDLQTANIEKRYEAEIKAAGDNSKKVAQLEKAKENEIAAVKNEAEGKKYDMQVFQAVAQTAISAINAYSSAAAIPIVGYILAPIAAAMAVAAGGIQIATLKKQRDAALAQGYAEGGYTIPGKKYEPAGIVHAGEWVASQELLANPTAAATIAQLDLAQRTNTIGSLDRRLVSASVSAPVAAAQAQGRSAMPEDNLSDTLRRLNDRLDEPFVTINTVTGDKGILRAQQRYEQLIRNKS